MRHPFLLRAFLLLLCGWTSLGAHAQFIDEEEPQTEAPYFQVNGQQASEDFGLEGTTVKANIAGMIADVVLTQTYVNHGDSTLQATYVFPASSKSAVYALKFKIGDREIQAEIKEKQEAKQIFQEAQQEGKTATLLEQHRPNVFQMSVANIQPNDRVEVELRYTETVAVHEGEYEFVMPTVVGPRYANADHLQADPWVQNPFTTDAKDLPKAKRPPFRIELNLNSGIPIHEARSVSHQTKVVFASDKEAKVVLDEQEYLKNPADFIFRYRLQGAQIESGLLLYEGEDENYFLLTVEPPKRVVLSEIPAREYVFIMDVSGSMQGFPLEVSKAMMQELLPQLRPIDRFNILFFAGSSEVLSSTSLPANQENIEEAMDFLDGINGGGATQMLPALKTALALPQDQERSRSFVILTDGFVTVEAEAFDLIRNNLGKANFFPVGIGSGVNRFLMEGMAHVGNTDPLIATSKSEALLQAQRLREFIQQPVLTDIEVKFDGFKVYDVEPVNSSDLFAERPLQVFGKYKGKPKGRILVSGKTGSGHFSKTISAKKKPSAENQALRQLWARKRIQLLSDYQSLGRDHKQEITDLGLKYSLLTKYTSFVGVDSEIRAPKKPQQTPNFSGGGATPEPHEWALIFILAMVAGYLVWTNNAWRMDLD